MKIEKLTLIKNIYLYLVDSGLIFDAGTRRTGENYFHIVEPVIGEYDIAITNESIIVTYNSTHDSLELSLDDDSNCVICGIIDAIVNLKKEAMPAF